MQKSGVCVSVLLLLLLLLVMVDFSQNSPVKSCCTRYQPSPIPVRFLKHYMVQDITGLCNMKAVIFRTKKNKRVCANPDSEWVQQAMETVPGVKPRLRGKQ